MPQSTTYLTKILEVKAIEVAGLSVAAPAIIPPTRGFYRALATAVPHIIAEVKKASPSKGLIRPDFHPAEIARSYARGGATALSVLTDEQFFQGSLSYLEEVRAACALPLLRKDFIIDPRQIYQAVGRADAVLLIVAALSAPQLQELQLCAQECGLDVLVEVHDRAELETALASGASIIGINNRNLKTFHVDLRTTGELLPFIPRDRVVVSESGISTPMQARELFAAGVKALLVGEAFMRLSDPGTGVRELLSGV